VEQSSASVVITNLDGNVEYVNPAFTRLTGYTFQEILGQNPRILKTGHTTDQEYKVLWDKLIQTKEWQGEFCNKKKNGEIYWENAIISPIVNNEGHVTHYVAVKENITERKHLLDKQNELIKMIENTDAFFATVDLNRNFLYGNPSLRKKLGIREEEDISMLNLSQFITPKARETNKEMNEIIMKEGKWTGENSYLSRDGIEIPVWQVIILHKNEKGVPTHISSTAIDLSKNKEAEKELFRLNNELRELSNHLQIINESDKKEIAKEIHDELGQGLTSLKFSVYWIKKHLMDDKAIIEKKLDELLAEISGAMISFRRIYTALNPSLLEEVGLKSSIDWLIDTFTRSENIQVKFDTNTENIQVDLDKSLAIYRIIQESLNNIMRYAKATSVYIHLIQSSSGFITLTISDNGIGFDINAIDSKKHHGLLSIRERVYALKGKLNLHSELNKGTLIEVEIPFT
jgi:PAS domain S-box-containing protein